MALMLSKLHAALRAGGVPEEEARAAAEEAATYEAIRRDTFLLKWMVGTVSALVLGIFWMQWHAIDELRQVQARTDVLEARADTLDGRMLALESRMAALERQGAEILQRLGSIEDRLPPR